MDLHGLVQRSRFWAIYAYLGGTLLLFIMTLTAVDVLGRYILNMPVRGSYDLVEIALVVTIFWFLPFLSFSGGHVTVSMFPFGYGMLSKLRAAFVEITCAVASAVLAWRLYETAHDYGRFNEETLLLGIPMAPVVYLAAAFIAISALVHLVRLVHPGLGPHAGDYPTEKGL